MIKNIAVTIQYDGTRYKGWQKQGNTDDTIQGKLEHILLKMTGKEVAVHGSGRTDAGVHARGQIANFQLDTDMEAEEIMDYINTYLPEDIAVISVREASLRFHSRLNALKKTYCYKIHTGRIPDAFASRYAWVYKDELDVEAMKEAASHLLGRHDFKSFTDLKKSKKSTIKCIESIDFDVTDNIISVTITGDSFLYHMVRIIIGTLVEVGSGVKKAEDMPDIISSCSRVESGMLAPSKGLTLMRVYYD